MHMPVAAWRGAGTTFAAGRTTAVVPRNTSNVFGARYVAIWGCMLWNLRCVEAVAWFSD